MRDSFAAAPARTEELESAFNLVFQHVAREERAARVDNALRLIRQGELEPAGVLVVRGEKGLLGAMVCLLVPGASALVWPPQVAPASQRQEIEDQLLQCACAWLRQRGAKLAQTLLSHQEVGLAGALERNGFAHITSLWYLRHGLDRAADLQSAKGHLTYQTYRSADRMAFQQTLLRTYEGTCDCPEVNGVRNLDEIIEGHQAQGVYDPERWWLALEAGRPVGVLLLTEVPEWQAWDVSYLGVVPEARRRGIGRELTCKALREARLAGTTQLTLSVDARNQPAWNLYTGLGFERFDEREVYLAIW